VSGALATAAREVLREEPLRWLNAARAAAAIVLALYVCFRLQLDSASSAAITTVLLALPTAGMVFEKSFYRLAGTFVGGTAALLLVAVFAQQREPFIIALTLWIAVSLTASFHRRNFRAYGYVLSGYTACLVGYPVFQQPEAAIQIATDRIAAVTVGVLCATLLNSVLFPRFTALGLITAVRQRFIDFVSFTQAALLDAREPRDVRRLQSQLVHDVVALETIRGASYFEDAGARLRSSRLRRLNAEFMASNTALYALYRLRNDLAARGLHSVLDALREIFESLYASLLDAQGRAPRSAADAQPIVRQLRDWLAGWEHRAAAARAQLEARAPAEHLSACRRELDSALRLIHAFACDAAAYAATYSQVRNARPLPRGQSVAFHIRSDTVTAMVFGLRSAVAILAVAAFWILSGWQDGFAAFLQVCVFSSLFASRPNPVTLVRGIASGFALGLPVVAVFYSFVLPRLDGFAELAFGLLPLLLLGGYWLEIPATYGRGTGFLVMVLSSISFTNPMQYDIVALLNSGLSTLLGLIAVALAFVALPPGEAWVRTRLLRALAAEIGVAARRRLRDARHAFESRVVDLIVQALERVASDAGAAQRTLDSGLAVLEGGFALIRLRELANNTPTAPLGGIALARLLRTVERGYASRRQVKGARDEIAAAIARLDAADAPTAEATADARDATRAMLRVIELSLADWASLQTADTASAQQPEALHAA
jgi:uncharacterized membrane protein YccC